MNPSTGRTRIRRLVTAAFCFLVVETAVRGQDEPAQAPAAEALPLPSVPQPTTPAGPISREAQLEARIQQLEAIVSQLQYQMSQTPGGPGPATAGGTTTGPAGGVTEAFGGTGGETGGRASGPGVPGQSFPPVPPVMNRFDIPAPLPDKSGKFRFGPGFELTTDDEEFILQFHDLTQLDYRGYVPGGDGPNVHSGFFFPRQWWMFNGHVTKEIGFFTSIANGIDTINMLDVFVDFNYDKRLQIRAGRMKTPFTYEFFIEPIQGLITPERSLFFNNFGQNRDTGIMAYGQLLNQPNGGSIVQYAAGVFNASRNGYYPLQDGRHVAAYLNFHPFGDFEGSIVENLNFGGSVLAGANAQTIATPPVLRTLQAISGNAVAGIPFLALNNNVGLYGPVAFWDMHAAWFYQQLAVIAEWQSGYQDYALNTSSATRTQHTNVPVGSYYVTAGYMLTGETRSQLGIVKPLRPFSLRTGQFGPGAWELFGRYNSMDVSDNIFTGGLAERFGNANRLWQTDVGLTWHMTQYIKCFFEWNHVEYNNPVTYAISPSGSPKVAPTNNILWARLQLFF